MIIFTCYFHKSWSWCHLFFSSISSFPTLQSNYTKSGVLLYFQSWWHHSLSWQCWQPIQCHWEL